MVNRIVTALLEHKFDVSKLESLDQNEYCYGPATSIVHNNVYLSFQLGIVGKDLRKDCKDHVGLYIWYVDGPTKLLTAGYSLFVARARGPERTLVCVKENVNEVGFKSREKAGWGSAKELPGTLDGLRQQGFLCQDGLLHTFAILFIPEDAFKDPKNKCPASSAQNPFSHHLYLQTETPTATDSPCYNRFELISKDGHHFWVHKEVLEFNSDQFKKIFDPTKTEDARFKYLREGRMTLENASGGALKEMITFIYLQHTTPDFDKFAMELVPVAETYGLKGLTLLCVQTLAVLTSNVTNIEELLQHLKFSQLQHLTWLEAKSAERLENVVKGQNDVTRQLLLKVTEQAHHHSYNQLKSVCQQKLIQHVNECGNLTVAIIRDLASEADKYGLNDLFVACGDWLKNNWEKVANNGQLSDMIEDKTGGLFTRLMASPRK